MREENRNEKKEKSKSDYPDNSWTKKEITQEIKRLTREVNKRLDWFDKKSKSDPELAKKNRSLQYMVNRARTLSGVSKGRSGRLGIGYGKSKQQLLNQAEELIRIKKYDTESPMYKREASKRLEYAYESFIEARPEYEDNMTMSQYIKAVNLLGGLGSLKEQFGSDNLVDLTIEMGEGVTQTSLVDMAMDVINNNYGQGKTQEELLDELRTTIKFYKKTIGRK